MRDDQERLRHILEAIERIQRYSVDGEENFHQQELLQTWMVHNLTIIGEAARSLSAEFRHSHPEVPWVEIIGMRHILVHDYFEIDLEILWQVLEKDLPPLEAQIRNLLLNQDNSHLR